MYSRSFGTRLRIYFFSVDQKRKNVSFSLPVLPEIMPRVRYDAEIFSRVYFFRITRLIFRIRLSQFMGMGSWVCARIIRDNGETEGDRERWQTAEVIHEFERGYNGASKLGAGECNTAEVRANGEKRSSCFVEKRIFFARLKWIDPIDISLSNFQTAKSVLCSTAR